MNPRKIHILLSLTMLTVLALGAGCSDDTTSPALFTQEEADDIASQVGTSLAIEDGGLLAMLPVVGVDDASKAAPDSLERTGQVGGLTYRYSVRYYDEAGNELSGYDPELAVRLQSELHVTGDVTTLRYQARVRHHAQLAAHGVNAGADTLRFSGDCADSCQGSFTAVANEYQRHLRVTSQATVRNLRYLKPVEAGELPIEGELTVQMTAARYRDAALTQLEAQVQASATVRFTGGDTAEIEIDGGWTYQLNLNTGQVTRT